MDEIPRNGFESEMHGCMSAAKARDGRERPAASTNNEKGPGDFSRAFFIVPVFGNQRTRVAGLTRSESDAERWSISDDGPKGEGQSPGYFPPPPPIQTKQPPLRWLCKPVISRRGLSSSSVVPGYVVLSREITCPMDRYGSTDSIVFITKLRSGAR